MDDMLTKAATALCTRRAIMENPELQGMCVVYVPDETDIALARAVLEAIREPSEEMVEEGFREQQWNNEQYCLHYDEVRDVYRAMMDAALNPPSP